MAGMLTESPAARLRNIANRIEDPQDRAELVQLAKLHEPVPTENRLEWIHFAPGGRKIRCWVLPFDGCASWSAVVTIDDQHRQDSDNVTNIGGWAASSDSAVRQAMDWAGRMVAA